MKNIILFIFLLLILGCSAGREKLETYIEEPKYLIEDPHFAAYQGKRDALEHEYLGKKITYAEYLERKKELDDQYEKEVKERNAIVVPER